MLRPYALQEEIDLGINNPVRAATTIQANVGGETVREGAHEAMPLPL